VRTRVVPLLLLLLLTAGCLPVDPLVPELKGRWAAPNAAKLRYALAADRYSNPPAPAAAGDCSNEYVTFGKRGIALHIHGRINPVFLVKDVQRQGARLILSGAAPFVAGAEPVKLELVLRNGEVRLDDVVDHRGRSVLYDLFENADARRLGVTTIGDVFRLVLDVKPCRA
jgi:hypothetical protein